ncbi:hypothetical protein P171DRAFT_209195 [Karstenula rhodostoma CBS 690.94]|uniref:Uncharacterized protein n=1 Tax=Karstenula rhodostoma CBS 690.94 TaxID=1392251 RepID=A0A9P4PN86_9PLEO|nr:hypothetical protein P171DRAFT_209195 [Karstenula rhodostoma CBS 690.94]
MPNLQFPSNPTSYRNTGWQIALMFLMGLNYLMDHDPRHIQYGKDQRARRKAEKHHYRSGFVTELPDAEGKHDEHTSKPSTPCTTREETRPRSPCYSPPPVSRDGKEAWPYPRGASHHNPRVNRPDEKAPSKYASKPTGRSQMRDAWTKMRAVTRTPYEYVRRVDGRKKRVTFNRDVQWFVFDVDEDAHDDCGKDMHGRR